MLRAMHQCKGIMSFGYLNLVILFSLTGGLQVMYEEATQVANDAVSGIRTIASFCAEHKVMKAYYGKCKAPVRQGSVKALSVACGLVYHSLYCIVHTPFVSMLEQSLCLMARRRSLKYSE